MSVGFMLHYAARADAAELSVPRFSVRGAVQRQGLQLQQGSLQWTRIGAPASAAPELFFCGQLANWAELAQRLATRGMSAQGLASPADCIRLIYRYYGAPGLRMLEGLFVGAFIDNGKVIAFASKTPGPALYYRVDAAAGTVSVSTELKALPAQQRKLRPFAEIVGQNDAEQAARTCLHDVLRVRPGHCVEIDLAAQPMSARDTQYYSACRSIALFEPVPTIARIREVIEQVVFSMPGRSAHCLVSGGLDSSIVAYLAQRRFDDLELFSLGTSSRNEFAQAEAFGASIGMPVARLLIEDQQFLTALPEVIALTEHCFSTFAEYLIPVHLAHQQIGRRADVMLSGYGSDVLFAGFAKPGDSLRHVSELVESEYASTAWANEASQCLGGSMGMEIGYPFFDSRVVDLAFSIDPYLKHQDGIEKYILREAYRDLLAPAVIARRKVGIHEGTGCEDFMSTQVDTSGAARARRAKDALCYQVLQQVLGDGVAPADVDMRRLRSGLHGDEEAA